MHTCEAQEGPLARSIRETLATPDHSACTHIEEKLITVRTTADLRPDLHAKCPTSPAGRSRNISRYLPSVT
jgi:hypothetical protein